MRLLQPKLQLIILKHKRQLVKLILLSFKNWLLADMEEFIEVISILLNKLIDQKFLQELRNLLTDKCN